MRISLVLGSGSARGYAHIGVIEELEARGHTVTSIRGCSMGALVGGVYAAGGLSELKDFVCGLTKGEVARMMDVSLTDSGVIKAQKVMHKLDGIIGDLSIEDLPINYAAVASDVFNRREVWFREGRLSTAIRASIAVPGFISPVIVGDRILSDGGVLNPLPVDRSVSVDTDAIVAVSLFGKRSQIGNATPTREEVENATIMSWVNKVQESMLSNPVGRALGGLLGVDEEAVKSYRPPTPKTVPDTVSVMEMSFRALDTMQAAIEMSRTAVNPPDVLISVPTHVCTAMDFHMATDVIEIGRELAVKEFDRAGL
ncbi:MAG: patatin-like phospholipase family protein [Actinomycetaceae bacterium]|nr:patatin-like phospholipase family protein [Actinomycetaceae bacterium]